MMTESKKQGITNKDSFGRSTCGFRQIGACWRWQGGCTNEFLWQSGVHRFERNEFQSEILPGVCPMSEQVAIVALAGWVAELESLLPSSRLWKHYHQNWFARVAKGRDLLPAHSGRSNFETLPPRER